jgi:hypothetical protein
MNIKAIICFALLFGFHSRGVGSTNVTLVSLGTNTTTFNVSTGQVCKIVYAAHTGTGGIIGATVMGGTFYPFTQDTVSSFSLAPIVVGPATITLNGGGTTSQQFCTLELSTPADSFPPSGAVVIPADSGGPVNIILESSADLINWYPSLPGTYGVNYTNRFFRVRAQRAQ